MIRASFRSSMVVPLVAALLPAQNGTWLQRSPTASPQQASGSIALAYDSARNQSVVIFLGQTGWQTWVYEGVRWTQRVTGTSPSLAGAVCFDSARARVVGVFGNQSTGLETWEWDGAGWSLRMSGGLPPRANYMVAFDSARNETVLFGGTMGAPAMADTWTWDGSAWTQRGSGGPTPRSSAGMTFDQQRGVVVLFGGYGPLYSQDVYLNSTWEWNGSYWYEHFNIPGPSARMASGMLSYDSRRGRTVLHGGFNNNQLLDLGS